VLISMAVGSGLWFLAHPGQIAGTDSNKLSEADRIQGVVWVGYAAAGIVLTTLVVMLVRRILRRSSGFVGALAGVTRGLSILLVMPFLVALRLANIEKDSPKLTLFLIAIAAALCAWWVYARGTSPSLPACSAGEEEIPRGRRVWKKIAPFAAALAVLAIWAFYGFFFSRLSILNHHALNTRTTDLGYYDNIFYQSLHGRPLGCTFIKAGYHGSAHFDPILVILSPLYLLYPRAEMLLVLQSVWLGAGVIPVYLLAKDKLHSRLSGIVLAAAYAMYPAMHGANMYEFHSLTLISPLLVWLLYFFEIGAKVRYYFMLGVLLLCREDVALLMLFVALYAILSRRAGMARLGWITAISSVAYFVIVKAFFMTSSGVFMTGKDAYSFAYYYEALIPNKTGIGGLLLSLLTNPVFAIKTAFEEAKVIFLILIFLPVAFLPFAAKPGRVMLIYGLLFCLLASRAPVFSISFQYSSVIYPIAFALTPVALAGFADGRLAPFLGLDGKRLSRALLGFVFLASVLTSWKFGAILDNASFKGGFGRVARGVSAEARATHAWVREHVEKIPPGASVGTTNKMGPHVSNRKEVYFYPDRRRTDYVFLDESELRGGDLETHNKAVARGEFKEIGRRGKIVLFKRK
jgi:uncharacterized membrane protein